MFLYVYIPSYLPLISPFCVRRWIETVDSYSLPILQCLCLLNSVYTKPYKSHTVLTIIGRVLTDFRSNPYFLTVL